MIVVVIKFRITAVLRLIILIRTVLSALNQIEESSAIVVCLTRERW